MAFIRFLAAVAVALIFLATYSGLEGWSDAQHYGSVSADTKMIGAAVMFSIGSVLGGIAVAYLRLSARGFNILMAVISAYITVLIITIIGEMPFAANWVRYGVPVAFLMVTTERSWHAIKP
ncbi:MAG TPA: hypothetical protein VN665_03655 [Candidatus Paceibacterota bacterium]|nr:hypothetical protein [Candidatus Paceibacterota bacterium]